MEFLAELGLFIVKTTVIVVAVVVIITVLLRGASRSRTRHHGPTGWIEVQKISDLHDSFKDVFNQANVGQRAHMKKKQAEAKAKRKEEKKAEKSRKKNESKKEEVSEDDDNETTEAVADKDQKHKLYVLNFVGDVQASQITALRNEISAVLLDAGKEDEVLVSVQSPGGLVHAYGLAASQLLRVRQAGVKLTVAVDQVAASGGYLMAAVADKIIAAPFALVGSIGVMAELPNFHRLLQKHEIDYELITAGEHKRTLTMFGENTDENRSKFTEEIEDVHQLFREFVTTNRPNVDDDKVKTGEAWYGQRAIELNLIDEIQTSDQYIMNAVEDRDVFGVKWMTPMSPFDRFAEKFSDGMARLKRPFGLDSADHPLQNLR